MLTLLRYLCVLLRASQQLAAEPVRWLPCWRLFCCASYCCCCRRFNSSSRSNRKRSRRCGRSLLGSKERGDRLRLHYSGRSSCRRSGGAGGGILFSLHVRVVGGLHTGCFPAHRGCVLCVIPRQMLYHPGDRRRGPVSVCGVTSGGVLSYVARVIFRLLVINVKKYHRGVIFCGWCGFLCSTRVSAVACVAIYRALVIQRHAHPLFAACDV